MKAVRRIVTGVNEKGQSVFTQDEGRADLFGGQGMEGFTDQGQLAVARLTLDWRVYRMRLKRCS